MMNRLFSRGALEVQATTTELQLRRKHEDEVSLEDPDSKKAKRKSNAQKVMDTAAQQARLNNPSTTWHAAAFKRPSQLIHAATKEANLGRDTPLGSAEARKEASKIIESARGMEYHETLLHVACLYSNFEVAAFLIENFPSLINKQYRGIYEGETALHMAAVNGDVELMKLLLRDLDKPLTDNANLASEVETFVEMISPDNRETRTVKRLHKNGKEEVVYERKTVLNTVRPNGTTVTTRIERQFLTLDDVQPVGAGGDPSVEAKSPIDFPEPRARSATLRRTIKANPNCGVRGEFFSRGTAGSVYFGDHPLSFAVCLNRPERKEIIRLLIKHGARLDLTDRYGNNLLHLCIYHEDVEMYNYICDLFDLYKSSNMKQLNDEISRLNAEAERSKKRERFTLFTSETYDLEKMKNLKGRTPLNYAIELGKQRMVETILTRRKSILWKYGPMAQVAYPLDEIDTLNNGHRDLNSALTILVYNSEKAQDERKAILESTPFKEIVQQKWDQFAKHLFALTFAHYITHLLAIVFLVVRPGELMNGDGSRGVFIHICEIFVLINSCIFLLREFHDFLQLRLHYLAEEGSRLFYLINNSSSILFLIAIPLRLLGFTHEEDMIVSTAGLLAFMYVLYFTRGNKLIGHYVVVLRRTVLKDLVQFGIIYIVFMLGFGLAFVAVFRGHSSDLFQNYPWTLLTLFKMTLFVFDGIDVRGSGNTGFAVTLFVVFTVLTGILMLTLLVATMNDSYSAIQAESKLQWHLERSSVILFMERRVPLTILSRFKIFKVGKPGSDLGLPDNRQFLVIAEKSDWTTDKSSKRLRNIFRHAIIRVCLAIVRRKVLKAKAVESSPSETLASSITQTTVSNLSRTKSHRASEMRFDILQSRVRVMNTLSTLKDGTKEDDVAEKLVQSIPEGSSNRPLSVDAELGAEDDNNFDPEDPASRVVVKDVVQDLITKQRVIRTWLDDEPVYED